MILFACLLEQNLLKIITIKVSIIRKSNFSPNPKRSVRKSNFHIKRSVLKTISAQQQKCNQKGLHFWYLQIN